MPNDVFAELEAAIKSFDKYYQYADDPRIYHFGQKQKTNIMNLFLKAASEDKEKAKEIYSRLMKSPAPKTADDIKADIKIKDDKILKSLIDQLHNKFSWSNPAHQNNWQAAAYICQSYRGLSFEPRKFIDNEINKLSKGKYKNHKEFCVNLFSRVLNKDRNPQGAK